MPRLTERAGWDAIEFLVEGLVPAADRAGVRLACHPHDPAYPVGGLNGVEHAVGSADGIRQFLRLSDSKNHGLNFCQGTVAEMFKEPAKAMIPVIEEFASTGRIFMVHFRNIRGGYLDFQEVFPDEGDVDMFEAIKGPTSAAATPARSVPTMCRCPSSTRTASASWLSRSATRAASCRPRAWRRHPVPDSILPRTST